MDNEEKLAALGTQDKLNNKKRNKKHNMCWTPLNANKHK